MKPTTIARLSILALLSIFATSCTTKADIIASIYPLEEMDYPVYYTASKPLTEGSNSELAVIMIQGWDGGVQVLEEQLSLQRAIPSAYVLSPMFPRTQIMERFGIEADGRAVWNDSWPRDLTIPGTPDDDWRGGGDANGTELSSFDVIDTLFVRLSNKQLFPNLKKIALVGFSAGGQFVGRYVAVGKGKAGEGITIEYAAMSPSTFLRLEPNDTWHYGLNNRPRYSHNVSNEQILENLRSRRCLHGCGALDTLEHNLDRTAVAMKQGNNRLVRFENFRNVVNQDACWSASVVFHTFDTIGHEAVKAYADPFFVDYVTAM